MGYTLPNAAQAKETETVLSGNAGRGSLSAELRLPTH